MSQSQAEPRRPCCHLSERQTSCEDQFKVAAGVVLRFFMQLLVAIVCLAIAGLDVAEAAKKKAAAPSPPKPIYLAPMRVVIVRNSDPKCEPTCPQWIAAEGEIMTSTPQAFRKAFKQMGKAKLPIIIRSPGGSIEAALEIGRMIRERDLTVAVGQTIFKGCSPADKTCKLLKQSNGVYEGVISDYDAFCNSACPMLLSGGTTRIISYLSSAGVHQPSTTWTREYVRYREYYKIINGRKKVTSRKILSRKNVYDKTTYGLSNRIRKQLGTYYKSMGIDLAILDETEKAKFQDMNYLTQSQTDKLKLRTTPTLAGYLSAPGLCGTTPTSAVCILDKSRDPDVVNSGLRAEAGITSLTPEMTFRLAHLKGSDCRNSCPAWIAAEGVITAKTPDTFRDFLKTTSVSNLAVVFNSQGGDMRGAIALGQEIRSRNLDTSIAQTIFESPSSQVIDNTRPESARIEKEGLCQGSCIAAFAGGINREIAADAKIRLHNPAVYEKLAGSFSAIIDMNIHLRKMGVAPTFIAALHDIKRGKSKQFQKNELLTFAVAANARDFNEFYKSDQCKEAYQIRGCYFPSSAPITKAETKTSAVVMKPVLAVADRSVCAGDCPIWIYAEGGIAAETLEAFKITFAAFGKVKPPVIMHSLEGDPNISLELGALFRDNSVDVAIARVVLQPCKNCALQFGKITVTPAEIMEQGQCGGSCVLAFAGGLKRIASSTSPLYVNSIATYRASHIQDWKLRYYFEKMGMQSGLIGLINVLEPGKSQGVVGKSQSLLGLINSAHLPTSLAKPEQCKSGYICMKN